MSDDLDRKIALSIEPMPTWTYPPDYGTAISDGRAWLVYFKGGAVHAQKPHSFLEPEMTLLLMKRLPPNSAMDFIHYTETAAPRVKNGMKYKVTIDVLRNGERKEFMALGISLEEAVRLAYARAEGLE